MGGVKNLAEIINNAWETILSLLYKYNTVAGGECVFEHCMPYIVLRR